MSSPKRNSDNTKSIKTEKSSTNPHGSNKPPEHRSSIFLTPHDILNRKLLELRQKKEEEAIHRRKAHEHQGHSGHQVASRKSHFQGPRKNLGPPSTTVDEPKNWKIPFQTKSSANTAVEKLKLLKSYKEPEPVAPPVSNDLDDSFIDDPPKDKGTPGSEVKGGNRSSLPVLNATRRKSQKIGLPKIDFVSTKNKPEDQQKTVPQPLTPKQDAQQKTKPLVTLQPKVGGTAISIMNTATTKPTHTPTYLPKDKEIEAEKKPQVPVVIMTKAVLPPPPVTPTPTKTPGQEPQNKTTGALPTFSSQAASLPTFTKKEEPQLKREESTASRDPTLWWTQSFERVNHHKEVPPANQPKGQEQVATSSNKQLGPASGDSVTVIQFTDTQSWADLNAADDDPGTHRPIAIERAEYGSPLVTKRLKNESALDILRTGKDEAPFITIIPADESKIVDQELARWWVHRKTFLYLCGVALCLALTIEFLTLYSSFVIFRFKDKSAAANKTNVYLYHTDLMILNSTTLNGFAILVFRIFIDFPKYKIVRVHVSIYVVEYCIFIGAYAVAFFWHKKITGQDHHCYTLHSWVGMFIAILLLWEAVTGIVLVYKPDAPIKKYHGSVGMAAFMLCGACSITGYVVRAMNFTGQGNDLSDAHVALNDVTAVLIIIYCCLVRYMATEFRFRKRSCPQWDSVFGRSISQVEESNVDNPTISLQKFARMAIREKQHST